MMQFQPFEMTLKIIALPQTFKTVDLSFQIAIVILKSKASSLKIFCYQDVVRYCNLCIDFTCNVIFQSDVSICSELISLLTFQKISLF